MPKNNSQTTFGLVTPLSSRGSMAPRGPPALPPDDVSEQDVSTALRVLKLAGRDTEGAAAIRQVIGGAAKAVVRREKQCQKQQRKAALEPPSAASSERPEPSAFCTASAPQGVVRLQPPHLSRPLYANPVCFLSTWQPGGGARNLMTISWLTAVDNDGHFACSMNQRRHSARNLARNPFLLLSVACAGLEPLLCKVGACSGRGINDKPRALGVPICGPGWRSLAEGKPADGVDGIANEDGEEEAEVDEDEAAADAPDALDALDGAHGPAQRLVPHPWPAEGDAELPCVEEAEVAQACASAMADGFAVAPCAAHVLARVTHARGVHGHFLLVCETVAAFVRSEYWSGKTLEPQREGVAPILSFMGSQRFAHSMPQPTAGSTSRSSTAS